jgi:hypothetical protein
MALRWRSSEQLFEFLNPSMRGTAGDCCVPDWMLTPAGVYVEFDRFIGTALGATCG